MTNELGSIELVIVRGLLRCDPKNVEIIDNWKAETFYGIIYNKDEE